jgi:hypothetical protein
VKKIVLLDNHGEKEDVLEALLKALFPECEICSVREMTKDGKSSVDLNRQRAKRGKKDHGKGQE